MKALEFLKSKRMIKEGFTKFNISGDFGDVELTQLLEEYAAQAINGDIILITKRLVDDDNTETVVDYMILREATLLKSKLAPT